MLDRAEIVRSRKDAFCQEEPGRQLAIGAGRPHDHRERPAVKTHLQRLYEKLGVSDRAAAVAEAMRRGLLE